MVTLRGTLDPSTLLPEPLLRSPAPGAGSSGKCTLTPAPGYTLVPRAPSHGVHPSHDSSVGAPRPRRQVPASTSGTQEARSPVSTWRTSNENWSGYLIFLTENLLWRALELILKVIFFSISQIF